MSDSTKEIIPRWPNNAKFAVCLTHDVDRVEKRYQYLTNSFRALIKSQFRHSIGLICEFFRTYFDDIKKNPYWNFPKIMELETQHNVKSTFFFLNENGKSKLSDPQSWKLYMGRYKFKDSEIKKIIKKLSSEGWDIGLHGSYNSYKDEILLKKDKRELEDIIGNEVIGIRQHYLNLNIPKTWDLQKKAGFKYDATFATFNQKYVTRRKNVRYYPFYLFDNTFLEIPLSVMDVTLFSLLNCENETCPSNLKSEDDLWKNIEDLMNIVEEQNGLLTVLWHQRVFNEKDFPGWATIYEKIIIESKKRNAWITNCRGVFDWMESIKNKSDNEDLSIKNLEKFSNQGIEKLNVLIPLPIYSQKQKPGGTETYVRTLINLFENYNLDITLIGIGSINADRTNLQFISIDKGVGYVSNFKFVCKLFLNQIRFCLSKPSLIVANRDEFCLPFLIPKKMVPIILTEHGAILTVHKIRRGKLFGLLYEFFVERFVAHRVDKIVTVNDVTANYFAKKYPEIADKICIIPLGVDLTRFRLMDIREVRKKHGFDIDEHIVISIGRLAEEKRIDLLLNSFKEVERQVKNIKLLIVGEGKEREKLEKLAEDLGLRSVQFMGAIDHNILPELLNCADLFTFTSSRETGPLVVLEALACGVPVITTDVGRIREFIKNDTVGRIVGSNKKEITGAIIEFLERCDYRDVRKACREVGQQFSFDNTAKETAKLYEKIYRDFYIK